MNMRHALTSIYAILYRDIQGRGTKDSLHHAGYPLHGQGEVLHFVGGQIVETRHDTARRYQDMARQEGLEVDYGKG
jgi:hypothetical protein